MKSYDCNISKLQLGRHFWGWTQGWVIGLHTVKQKVILITGCDSGFGYSLACHVAEKHPKFKLVACCFEMDSEGAKDLISKGITVFQLDVTDNDSIEKLRKDVDALLVEKNGELWTLVNNAATLVFADAIFQTR